MFTKLPSWGLLVLGLALSNAFADTTEVKTQTIVEVKKSGGHCEQDPNCFNRYHPAIKPVARAKPGDLIVVHTRDALDANLNMNSLPKDVTAIDTNLIHPMTGPIYIEGAKRGDVLAIKLIDINPNEYGYTTLIPGFGFLPDMFPDPYVANWKLNRYEAVSAQLPGVRIPMNGFMGSVGVMPGEEEVEKWLARENQLGAAGGVALPPQPISARPADICGPKGSHKDKCLRTVPPRENGGNMDVKQMVEGTTLLLPCFIDGCGFFIGDVHYAQGDGEVAGTAIEMGASAVVRFRLLAGEATKRKTRFPRFSHPGYFASPQWAAPHNFVATTGLPIRDDGTQECEDLTLAARNALLDMIELLGERGFSREQAYVICSLAVDLRISNAVDLPNVCVSALLPEAIFEK